MTFTPFTNLCCSTLLVVAQLLSFIPQVVHCHEVNCTETKVQVTCGTTAEDPSCKSVASVSTHESTTCCKCSHSSFAKHRKAISSKSKSKGSNPQQLAADDQGHHHHLRMQESILGSVVTEEYSSSSVFAVQPDPICFTSATQPEVAGRLQSMQLNSVNPPLLVLPLRI